MGMREFLFTSESVTGGHPDKVADQISDAVLDEILRQDPRGRVACETMVTTGLVVVAGEITTKGIIDFPDVVRKAVTDIGYTGNSKGFDAHNCAVVVAIVCSTQHAEEVGRKALTEGVLEEIVRKSVPKELLSRKVKFYINPTGRFVVGGPHGDTGGGRRPDPPHPPAG